MQKGQRFMITFDRHVRRENHTPTRNGLGRHSGCERCRPRQCPRRGHAHCGHRCDCRAGSGRSGWRRLVAMPATVAMAAVLGDGVAAMLCVTVGAARVGGLGHRGRRAGRGQGDELCRGSLGARSVAAVARAGVTAVVTVVVVAAERGEAAVATELSEAADMTAIVTEGSSRRGRGRAGRAG